MHVKATETYLIIYVLLEDYKWLNVGEQKIMQKLNDQNLENTAQAEHLKGTQHSKLIKKRKAFAITGNTFFTSLWRKDGKGQKSFQSTVYIYNLLYRKHNNTLYDLCIVLQV